jgi:hypothetical protein
VNTCDAVNEQGNREDTIRCFVVLLKVVRSDEALLKSLEVSTKHEHSEIIFTCIFSPARGRGVLTSLF